MKHKKALVIGSIILLIVIVTLWAKDILQWEKNDAGFSEPVVDPALVSAAKLADSLDYLIYFEEKADLTGAYELSWEERGWYVYDTLVAQAEESQAKVRKYLDKRGVTYQSFWIDNVIAVEDSNALTFNGLMKFLEIESIQSIPVISLANPIGGVIDEAPESLDQATPNQLHINADDAWSAGFMGQGLVVGSIDTGVRYTHEALKDQYRGYSEETYFSHGFQWWDAVNGSVAPYDDHGHGTHTTGIMVGTDRFGNVLGVAPEAQWMACKAIDKNGSGLGWDFLECGQFMLAPWDQDGQNNNPNLRPHVVNNSWGNCSQSYTDWFAGTIDAWLAAGIYPVFANGNASNCGYEMPPGLGTVGSPARAFNVTAVGATGADDGQLANFSTWGPTDDPDTLNGEPYPLIKPQVVAPGVNIRSSVSSADNDYAYWGGTSMAAPHVSGLVALMWQAGDCLLGDYAQTENLIEKSAVPIPYETGSGDEGPGNVPNHATGWGEIDVIAAVEEAEKFCGDSEEMILLSGSVMDGGGHGYPLYARVSLVSDHHKPVTYTDPFDGSFSMKVYRDVLYNLEITSEIPGYQPIQETRLVFSEQNAIRDYQMPVVLSCDAPGYLPVEEVVKFGKEIPDAGLCSIQEGGLLAGFVVDIRTGLPADDASISRDGYFVESQGTPEDPNLPDGFYWAFQPTTQDQESITILAAKDFYQSQEVDILIKQDSITQKDFALRHYRDILKASSSMLWEKVVDFAGVVWDKIAVFGMMIWDHIAQFFIQIWEKIAAFFSNIWQSIVAFFNRLSEILTAWFIRTFKP
ncbi:MAG: S8 family serine peptidase [Brevefilum sp.]|nr:S8 family serine peptidase [Brevefilum sp.]